MTTQSQVAAMREGDPRAPATEESVTRDSRAVLRRGGILAAPWLAGSFGGIAAWQLGQPASDAAFVAACWVLLAQLTIVDLRERRLPNIYTYWGTAAALGIAAIRGGTAGLSGANAMSSAFLEAVVGMLAATIAMGALYWLGKGRLGLGDVKLAAFIGAALGITSLSAFMLASTLLGAVVATVVLIRTRDRHTLFAYGPCMAVAAGVLLILLGPAGS
jgi:leader peptidase (prepilin peptidase)/N-methyltransferase